MCSGPGALRDETLLVSAASVRGDAWGMGTLTVVLASDTVAKHLGLVARFDLEALNEKVLNCCRERLDEGHLLGIRRVVAAEVAVADGTTELVLGVRMVLLGFNGNLLCHGGRLMRSEEGAYVQVALLNELVLVERVS